MEISEKELNAAKGTWYFDCYLHRETDREVEAFLQLTHSGPWIEKARRALLLATKTVATKLQISREEYRKIEKAERSGSVSIRTLQKCAEAMGCELVYGLRPKNRGNFSQQIWDQLYDAVKDNRVLSDPTRERRSAFLYGLVQRKMRSPQFRRQMGWGNNSNPDVV